jgi:hypothetical protein
MKGPEMKFIRTKCGYTAEEFGVYIEKSERTVYRMEDYGAGEVKVRYVDALREFVGKGNFDECMKELEVKKEEERKWREERDIERAQVSASSPPRTFMGLKYRS